MSAKYDTATIDVLFNEARARQASWATLDELDQADRTVKMPIVINLLDTEFAEDVRAGKLVSPFDGTIVKEVEQSSCVATRLSINPVDGNYHNSARIVTGYRLATPYGNTPAFVELGDLIEYLRVMTRTVHAPELQVNNVGMFANPENPPEHCTTFSKVGNTYHGLYAVVGESGFQMGPYDKAGYAPYIESVHRCFTSEELQSLHEAVRETNKEGRDLSSWIRRVSITMWDDASCDLKGNDDA